MDNRKEQERAELHRTIWNIANDLRGSVDGWDFKQFVLGMLFYRYISENITAYINVGEHEAGDAAFDYAKLSDRDAEQARVDLVKTKGFFILPSELFENVHACAKDDENLNVTLERIFSNIEVSAQGTDSEDDFKGLFDDFDVNSNKLGGTVAKRNENLVKLMNGVAEMKLGEYKNNTIDAFGDAYEFLMGMYASNAGKSGGEYYTPQEVSELLTRLTLAGKTEVNKVYDPACGSGSLLLKFAKILGKENVRQGFFGQEVNITTYNLCRINMFLHDIDYDKFDIAHGDTLTDPLHWDDEPFEAIVSNPPYSIKWKGDDDPILINDPRFSPAGVLAPKSKADLAFIMHSLSWLATNGTAAIVCFPGLMYRGGAEQKIRQYLIDNNYIDCVIQLPDNLFYGTSIATCIMVLKKSKSENSTLFIDSSKECVKVTNNNKLTQTNIDAILAAFTSRKDIAHFSKLVPNADIAAQNFNLSVSTYVEQEDTRERVDILALNAQIGEIVAREQLLRDEIAKIITEIEILENASEVNKVPLSDVGTFIRGKRFVKTDMINDGTPCIHYGELYTHYGVWANQAKSFISPELAAKLRFAHTGNVVIVAAGETIEDIGKGVAWLADSDVVVHDACYIFEHNLEPKYVSYFLRTKAFHSQIKRYISSGKISSISADGLGKASIPVPSIEVQKKIVSILDRFNVLYNDLTSGLTAEIEARRKQYEYYRDELLTFKEKSS